LADGVAIVLADFLWLLRVDFEECAELAADVADKVLHLRFSFSIGKFLNQNLSMIPRHAISFQYNIVGRIPTNLHILCHMNHRIIILGNENWTSTKHQLRGYKLYILRVQGLVQDSTDVIFIQAVLTADLFEGFLLKVVGGVVRDVVAGLGVVLV
jgi:hypothetical protein